MKSVKELFEAAKQLFAGELPPAVPAVVPPAPAAPAAKTYKLADGSEISVTQAGEVPAVGDSVTANGAPAAEGEHKLEDGSAIVVDAAGVITEVKPVEPVTTVVPPAPTFEERLAALEAAIAGLSAPAIPTGMATETALQAASQKIDKQGKTIEALFEVVEKLTEEPTADPATLSETKRAKFERASKREDRMQGYADAIKAIKESKK